MSAHTAGPWAIDWNVSRIDVFSSDAATLIATIRRSTPSDGIDADARANARLIAAAPELLEALRPIAEHGVVSAKIIADARAAYAKAVGGDK